MVKVIITFIFIKSTDKLIITEICQKISVGGLPCGINYHYL